MDFSPEAIIAIITAALVAIGAAVKVFKDVAERIDQKRKEREEKAKLEKTESVENRKLDQEIRTLNFQQLRDLLTDCRAECKALKEEIDERDKTDSLSRPTITKLYQSMRAVGRQIDTCELLLIRGESRENVIAEFEILKQKFVETESLLP